MAKVLEFTGATKCAIDPDKILRAAIGKLDRVVLIGINKDGGEFLAMSEGDASLSIWDIERAKHKLISVPDISDR
jgi:hypothetical protein